MAGYKIYFRQSVLKDLTKIPKRELQRIIKRIEKLASDPKPRGCEKISGQDRFRIRQGSYRIIYSIQDDKLTIWVVKIGHRRDIYRKLEKGKSYGNVHE
jgi:mRNA interferase RelE/StbE